MPQNLWGRQLECLNKDVKKKKGQILYIGGTENQFATSAKLLDVTRGSYGFSCDLIETTN